MREIIKETINKNSSKQICISKKKSKRKKTQNTTVLDNHKPSNQT